MGAFFAAAFNPRVKANDPASLAKRTLLGGAASRLGGGKFANGAFSAAMAYVLNDNLHPGDGRIKRDHHLAYAASKEIERISNLTDADFLEEFSRYGYARGDMEPFITLAQSTSIDSLRSLVIGGLSNQLRPGVMDGFQTGMGLQVSPKLSVVSSVLDSVNFLRWLAPYINDTTYNFQYECKDFNCHVSRYGN